MNLVSQVVFTYDINDKNSNTGETGSFTTADDLKLVLKNGKDYFTMPYELRILRVVKVSDTEKYTTDKVLNPNFISAAHPHPVVLGQDGCDLIVANKLAFPDDVRQVLKQKYNDILNFDMMQKWDEKQPVYFGGVTEKKLTGLLPSSQIGARCSYTMRSVNCRYLNNQDIIVDENLNQIWPEKTNKMPVSLVQLLSRTKEIIH